MNHRLLLAAILAIAPHASAFSAQLSHENFIKKGALPLSDTSALPLPQFTSVAEKALPSTVFIKVQVHQPVMDSLNPYDMFGDDFFRRFFGQQFNSPVEPQPQVSGGSGFIISADDYIVTNKHVIENASQITVILDNGKEFTASIKGSDPRTDLALLKIEATQPPFLRFGDSEELKVGEDVVALGNPFGIKGMHTRGIISAKSKQPYEDFLITDAAINPGNSGGPLLNIHGEVVGINTAILTRTGGYMGIGFCVPSNIASHAIEQMREYGHVKRAYLGVVLQGIDADLLDALELESGQEGVLISEVIKDSPAFQGGLQQGDIILQYNGKAVTSVNKFRNEIGLMTPGSEIDVKVLRNQTAQQFHIKLGAQSDGEAIAAELTEKLGIEIENLTADYASRLGYSSEAEGVWIKNIKRGSPAALAGLSPTYLITAIGSNLNHLKKIRNKTDFENALQELGDKKHLIILVRHQNFQRYYTIKMN